MTQTKSTGSFAGVGLILCFVALLALTAGPASAKKPPKPGGDDGSVTNPALAYAKKGQVSIATADASAEQTLTKGRSQREAPAWSPDGTQIAYLQEIESGKIWRDLYVMAGDGSSPTCVYSWTQAPVPEPYAGLSWLPDGTRILYTSGDFPDGISDDVRVLTIATGQVQRLGLTSLHDGADIRDGAIGPDVDPDTSGYQGWLCYVADGNIHAAAVSTDSDGSLVVESDTITGLTLQGSQIFPVWSPSCDQIVYLDDTFADGGHELMVVEFDRDTLSFGTPQTVYSGTVLSKPTWSPDGAWIAFSHSQDIYRVRPDGTGLTNLTASRSTEIFPNWNPDWTNDID